jgi:outer membrane biosynthesis protein TonB
MTTKLLATLVLLASAGTALADLAPPPPPPPPPPEPPPPETVPPKKMEELRKAGSAEIPPDDATQKEMAKGKKDQIMTAWKVCVTKDGDIMAVGMLKTSGYKDWDTKIDATIRKTWKFKPYTVDGKAKTACTAESFTWSKKK